jgi:hypothetical protein
MQNGIIYRGPSLYDGAPIVVVATFTKSNSKTGGVVQTYILRDDVDPRDASKGGQDVSICGSCPHRGEVNHGSSAQDRQGPHLLRQPWAGRSYHVARAAAWRLSRRAGCNIARSDWRGTGRARRDLRGSRRGTAGDLDRAATRRGKLDSLYPF